MAIAAIAGALSVCLTLAYVAVRRAGAPIYTTVADVPARPVAIVFGAGYGPGGRPTPVLLDRVRTAADLYRAGKVRKLLMTGDNSRRDYDEPAVMRATAIRFGVPAQDIVVDDAGFRTWDSLYRARDIFGVRSAVLVTQAYHLPRALYLGRALGLDVVGAAADRQQYAGLRHLELREVLSIENAWLQVNLLHPRPHFLGKQEPIAM